MRRRIHSKRSRRALPAGLIVLVAALVGAAVVMRPQASQAGGGVASVFGADPGEKVVRGQLAALRAQVAAYRADHNGAWPDLIGGQWAPLTQRTDVRGSVTAGVRPYGPFLSEAPVNPLNGLSRVAAEAGAGVGYVFEASSGRLWATAREPKKTYEDDGEGFPGHGGP